MEWRGIVTRTDPEKSLTWGRQRHVGRNRSGRITVRHKGGGVKRLWRDVDFRYDKVGIPARVAAIEYDPNRTCLVALVVYRDGEKRYVVAPEGWRVGSEMLVSPDAPVVLGNRMPLARIPVGTVVYHVELERGKGGVLARSAGAGATILAQEGGYTHIGLPSKEVRMVNGKNFASIGSLSNPEHRFMSIGNAGRARRMGRRPTVRGTAMNPVDHPHGGGEGRTQVGRRRGHATTWGKPARGVKTRKKKKGSNRFIISRRKK